MGFNKFIMRVVVRCILILGLNVLKKLKNVKIGVIEGILLIRLPICSKSRSIQVIV